LRATLDALATGISRNDLAARAAAQSQNYRAGGGSLAIRSQGDALAYAFTRLPATYAAAIAVFNALHRAHDRAGDAANDPSVDRPGGFEPRSLLDIGAGPGTAAFAAAAAFGTLTAIRLVEPNAEMRALGSSLMAQAASPALRTASYLDTLAEAVAAPAATSRPRICMIRPWPAGVPGSITTRACAVAAHNACAKPARSPRASSPTT